MCVLWHSTSHDRHATNATDAADAAYAASAANVAPTNHLANDPADEYTNECIVPY